MNDDRAPARLIVVTGADASAVGATARAIARRLHVPALEEASVPDLAGALTEAAARKGAAVCAAPAMDAEARDALQKAAGEPILFVVVTGTEEVVPPRDNLVVLPGGTSPNRVLGLLTPALAHLRSFKRWQ